MSKTILAVVIFATACVATPAMAGHRHHHSLFQFRGIHHHRNDTQSFHSGGRGGKHYGQRYGRTSH